MQIARIRIKNFRCIKEAEIFPTKHNLFLGPNNVGKTAVLEALNLVLNPELTYRINAIDENDFYQRNYQPIYKEKLEGENKAEITQHPKIYIEVVICNLNGEDEDIFRENIIPWKVKERIVIESTEEGVDPFTNAVTAIRAVFEGWYDPEEDDFFYETYLLRKEGMEKDECPRFSRDHKRHIGFLIYRDYRALMRPITLAASNLFSKLLKSQNVIPKHFETVIDRIKDALEPMIKEEDFISLLNSYKAEMELFLPLSKSSKSAIFFNLTDRTRNQLKDEAQLYVYGDFALPIHKMGAGTRSLAILSMLSLIMRRRGQGILALEEPETFLFPHAQRRVIDEMLDLANQTFITTHSAYVLERIPVEGVGRVERAEDGIVKWNPISDQNVKDLNLYSKRLKQVHCEALMGQGVLIVEGDSDKWWLMGASRILNRKEWLGKRQKAFELQGIAVVSADTSGDIIRLGRFFHEAGLKVVGIYDNTDDKEFTKKINACPYPSLILKEKGLEEILSNQLPIDILKTFITKAPYCKTPLKTVEEVDEMSEEDVRKDSKDRLIENKGSASMHEWLISLVDESKLPKSLGNIVYLVSLPNLGFLSLKYLLSFTILQI